MHKMSFENKKTTEVQNPKSNKPFVGTARWRDLLCKAFFNEFPVLIKEIYMVAGLKPISVEDVEVLHTTKVFEDKIGDNAFVVGNTDIVLVEHQSTYNPNISLRMLNYLVAAYDSRIDSSLLYGSR